MTRLYTYHLAEPEPEPAPLPVHLLTPQGRTSTPKVRAFLDFAARRLRAEFARLSADAEVPGSY